MRRAVIYARVSTDNQQRDNDSLPSQEADCRAFAAQQATAWRVEDVKGDIFTGKNSLDERQGLQQAIRMIREGKANTLLVRKVNRAGRDIVDGLLMHQLVCEAGGTLHSVIDGEFTSSAEDKLRLSILLYQAEKDLWNIRDQTQRGIRNRVERGRPLVSVPLYGYRYVDAEKGEKYAAKALLVPDEEAAPIVEDIYAKADAGWSCNRIAHWLTERGVPTPSQLLHMRGQLGNRRLGETWTASAVYYILINPSYTGRHEANRNKTTTIRRQDAEGKTRKTVQHVRRAAGDAAILPVTIPALVDDALWQRVQEMLKTRQLDSSQDAEVSDEPLLNKGIAICGVCGARMVSAKHHKGGYRMYVCSHRSGNPQDLMHVCPGRAYAVRASKADADVWEKFKAIIKDDERYARLVKSKADKVAEDLVHMTQRREALLRELEEAKARQALLYERMMAETNAHIYALQRADLERTTETITALQARADDYRGDVDRLMHQQDLYTAAREMAAQLVTKYSQPQYDKLMPAVGYYREEGEPLDNLSREEKRRLLRGLDVKVKMYPTTHEYSQTHDVRWQLVFSDGGQAGIPANGIPSSIVK